MWGADDAHSLKELKRISVKDSIACDSRRVSKGACWMATWILRVADRASPVEVAGSRAADVRLMSSEVPSAAYMVNML